MKSKSLFLVFLMAFVLVLSACAPKEAAPVEEPAAEEPAEAPAEEPAMEEKPVFASVVSIGDTWFVRYEEGVLQFGEDYGVESFMEGPSQPDSAAQVAIIEDLIAQGVDVIVNIPYGVPENEVAQKKAMAGV